MINQDYEASITTKSVLTLLTQLKIVTEANISQICLCVYVDYQGFDSGAESSVLTLLLTESRLWEKWEGVHSVALPGLRHHLRHHDRLGPCALSSSRSTRPGGDKGPLAEWRGVPPSGAAETHTPQVLHRLLFWNRWGDLKVQKISVIQSLNT